MKLKLPAFVILVLFCACSSTRQVKKAKGPSTPVLSENLVQKQKDGIDFFARGSIPASWNVEIEFGNLIRFKSLDGTDATSSAVQPQIVPAEKATRYTSKATNGNLDIVVYDEACTEGLSGEQYDKKVIVTVNGKRYEGCGQYLFDGSLNGKWTLQKINNKTLKASDFAKGLPVLQLTLLQGQGKTSGHDGCNTINGSFEIMGSKIKFSSLALTKMACPANKTENEFLQLISDKTVDYYFKDGQLFLYLMDDSIIVFKKG